MSLKGKTELFAPGPKVIQTALQRSTDVFIACMVYHDHGDGECSLDLKQAIASVYLQGFADCSKVIEESRSKTVFEAGSGI